MKVFKAVKHLSSIIGDAALIEKAKILNSSFIRNRKITLEKLLNYLIFRGEKVLSQDLTKFFSAVDEFDIPTRQAMIKRMNLLNFDVWDEILKRFRKEIYSNMTLYTLKNYIVIAFDGSFANLPSHDALKNYFGGHMTKKMKVEDIVRPQAKISMAYDVINKLILDFSIGHYRKSEIPMMFEHLEKLLPILKGKKVIFLADRYYGSAEFFKFCEMHGFNYIVRAKKNFFKKLIAEHEGKNDFEIDIEFDKAWIKRIKQDVVREAIENDPHLQIRVVKGTYTYVEKHKNKEKEITVDAMYFTNLGDEFETTDIINVYHFDRWKIESAYDVLKNDLDIEQFNTHNPIGIKNEIMGKVIFYNIERLMFMEAKEKVRVKEDVVYQYIPNNKHLINMLRTGEFIKGFFKGLKKKIYSKIIKASSSEKIPIRKDRHYKRWGKFYRSIPNNRHRIDGRRNPPVKVTKVGLLTGSQ